jgi:hypothetical protein
LGFVFLDVAPYIGANVIEQLGWGLTEVGHEALLEDLRLLSDGEPFQLFGCPDLPRHNTRVPMPCDGVVRRA